MNITITTQLGMWKFMRSRFRKLVKAAVAECVVANEMVKSTRCTPWIILVMKWEGDMNNKSALYNINNNNNNKTRDRRKITWWLNSVVTVWRGSTAIAVMDARLRRVNKEISGMLLWTKSPHWWLTNVDCKNDKTSGIKIELIDESPFHLKGSFPGPQDTPYEGGHFEVVRL